MFVFLQDAMHDIHLFKVKQWTEETHFPVTVLASLLVLQGM